MKDFFVRKEWPYIFFAGFGQLLILIGAPTGFGESNFSPGTVMAHKVITLGGFLILLFVFLRNTKRFKFIKGAKASLVYLSVGAIVFGFIAVFAIIFGVIVKTLPSYIF